MHENQAQRFEDEISLKQIILVVQQWSKFIISKWQIVLLAAAIGGMIGLTYAYLKKTTYTATLTFALEEDKGSGSMGGALGLASSFGFDLGSGAGGAFAGSNLIELMKSRRIVEKTLLDTVRVYGKLSTLAEVYIDIRGWRKGWANKPGINERLQFLPGSSRDSYTVEQDSILSDIYTEILNTNLFIDQKNKKISIINVDVVSPNELFAKYFAELIAKEVSEFYVQTKSKKSKMNVDILERQTDSVRRELNSAISGVATLDQNAFNLNPALITKRAASQSRQVDIQANTAILSELVKNLELARVALRKETPLIQIIDRPILPLTKNRISKKKSLMLGTVVGGGASVIFLIGATFWRKLMHS